MGPGEIAGLVVGISLGCSILSFILGWFISKKLIQKQLKKNPPITKDTIRMIYSQVGRKPTEKQVNEIYTKATKVK